MLRKSLAAVVILAGAAAVSAPASGAVVDRVTPTANPASSYGPGYSPDVTQEDSYYPTHGDPRIDALSYNLALKWLPGTATLQGTATVSFRAVQTSPDFQLDLAHSMQVSSVKTGPVGAVSLVDTPSTHNGKDLVVQSPVQAGKTYQVTITYTGKPHTVSAPTSRVDMQGLGWHRAPHGQAWTDQEPFGAYTWYPVNDMPADKAMYSISLDVPDREIGVSNGALASNTHLGTRRVTTFSNQHPMPAHLVTVAIGPYRRYTQTGPNGLPMTYWYPKGREDLLAPLKHLPTAMTWLERRLGAYPFSRVGVVIVPSDVAVETQTMVTLGSGNYRYGNRDVLETVVHQLIKSWYGDSVTPSDWRDLWMNEGMATWLEAQYSAANHWKPWRYWLREFNRNDPYWREIYGPPGAYASHEFGQRNVSYCTARMLNKLRAIIGNQQFYAAMKDWPAQFADQNKNRDAYIGWLEARTGKKLKPFFDTELDDAKPTL